MNSRLSPLASLVVLALFVLVADRVAADAIPPMPQCAPWQMAQRRGSLHSGGECVPRACRRNANCGASSRCGSRHACFAQRVRWDQPGPCLDRDDDGECDNRVRRVETVEVGECDAQRRCGEGRCRRVRECIAPPTLR